MVGREDDASGPVPKLDPANPYVDAGTAAMLRQREEVDKARRAEEDEEARAARVGIIASPSVFNEWLSLTTNLVLLLS